MSVRMQRLTKPVRLLAIVSIIGLLGVIGLNRLSAATSNTAVEAEPGAVAAPASVIDDTSASLDKAVAFGKKTTCPNQANTPGGSDGRGGCFPYAGNTGAPASIARTSYTGPTTVTTNGTVIDGKTITGGLVISASNVTVRNSVITTTGYYGLLINGTNTLIEDSTIIGGQTAGIAPNNGGNFTATRVNVYGGEDGVRLATNSKLIDSYVHDLVGTAESHYDTVTADGFRGWEIRHSTILNQFTQTAAVWVGDPRYDPSEGLLTESLLGGGGYCVYGGPGIGQGIRVINNVFSRAVHSRCGYYGLVTYWQAAGNTWTGNVYSDGVVANP